MIIAGLTILIGLLFGGGNISAFLIEDLPKEIKHNVDDKEKQKEILAVLKEFDKEFKKAQKEIDKSKKELKKLNLERTSSEESIRAEFDKVTDIWKKLQTDGIEKRIQVTSMLTEDEWEKIVAGSVSELDKKEQKSQDKIFEDFEKELNKTKKEIKKSIPDVAKANKIEDAFLAFSNEIKAYITANMDRTLRNYETFRNLNATKDELEEALSNVENSREKVFDGIINLHFELVELTTDDEWKSLAKAVNDLY